MRIDEVKPSDLNSIYEVIYSCSEKYILPELSLEGKETYLKAHTIKKLQEYIKNYYYQVIKTKQGQIVGIVGIKEYSHLYHLHVLPEYHLQGIGRKLWYSIRDISIERKNTNIFTVNSSNYATSFYIKLGFKLNEKGMKNGVVYNNMEYRVSRQ